MNPFTIKSWIIYIPIAFILLVIGMELDSKFFTILGITFLVVSLILLSTYVVRGLRRPRNLKVMSIENDNGLDRA